VCLNYESHAWPRQRFSDSARGLNRLLAGLTGARIVVCKVTSAGAWRLSIGLDKVGIAAARPASAGDDIKAAIAGGAELVTKAGFVLDYFEARHADTLAPIASVKDGPARILVAAKMGTIRLIDNVAG